MIGPRLEGEKVILRPLRNGDLARRAAWMNDAETVKLFTGTEPVRDYALDDARRWRQVLEADIGAEVWAVETKGHHHIGDVDLHSIDRSRRMAKLTILLGDKRFWNAGYGTDTIKTVLRHAFLEMGLDSVSLRVYDFNRRAIRCYEKCGFAEIGKSVPEPGLPSGAGEVYMTVTKDRFLAENQYASVAHR